MTFTDGNCTITVVNDTQPNLKTVTIESTAGDYKYQMTKKVSTAQIPFIVTNQ
ncbi:MAG: hypothetical protein WCJ19_03625 [bacterium]